MDIAVSHRFRSGQLCSSAGWYVFDGYVDGSIEPLPAISEMEVSLEAGDVFPQIRNVRKTCYWRREVSACDERLQGAYCAALP